MEERKRLTRSTKDKILGGVCGGIANYFALDPTLIRIGYILLSIFTILFSGVLAYFILWIIVPQEPAE